MSDPETAPPAKPKRVMSDAQRAALSRGQAKLAEKRAAKRAGAMPNLMQGALLDEITGPLVQTTSTEIRELQREREETPPEPKQEDDWPDEETDSEPPPSLPPAPARSNGQANGHHAPRVRSIDDVVKKHAEPEPPPIAEVARQTKLYTIGKDPLPPPEDESRLSDGVIASSDVPDLAGDTDPKNLADLMNQCPMIGDGQYYIEVVRRAPQHYGGVICKGTQRPITAYMTMKDFVRAYGGGDYTLVLYGPPKRGLAVDPRSGSPRQKALSPPVKFEISTSTYAPNLQAAVLDDDDGEEEEDMRYTQTQHGGGGGVGRPTTTPDVRYLEVQLTHEEKRRDREEAKEREFRASQQELAGQIAPMLDVVRKSSNDSVQALERTATERNLWAERQAEEAKRIAERAEAKAEDERRRADARIEAEKNRPTDVSSLMSGMAEIMKANKSDDGSGGKALDQARDEIQRLTTSHAAEVQRLTTMHTDAVARLQDKQAADLARAQQDFRAEIQRTTDLARNEAERVDRANRDEVKRIEDRLKENLERAERRAEEAERKAETRVREAEDRAEKRITDVRAEGQRALDDLRATSQQRLDDERRQHDRDTKSGGGTFQVRLDGQKDMYENRLSTIAAEIVRLTAEVERYRKEAEDNKDITKHIERAEAAAAALGWAPSGASDDPEAPKDWKEMIGKIGMDLVQKLPEIVQSAGQTVREIRGGGQPPPTPEQAYQMQHSQMMADGQHTVPRQMAEMPPPLRGRGGMPFEPAALRFGTEDGGGYMDPTVPPPRPHVEQTFAPQQPMVAPAPMQIAQPPIQAPAAMMPQMQMPVQQQPPPPPPQQQQLTQAPAGAVPVVIPSDMILQYSVALEQALASGGTAQQVAQELIPLLGRENLARVIQGLRPERVVAELQKAGRSTSPLVRRSGQQFLKELWAEAGKLLGSG